MKVPYNRALIAVESEYNLSTGVKGHNGEEIIIGRHDSRKEYQATIVGELVSVPERLAPTPDCMVPVKDEYEEDKIISLDTFPLDAKVGDKIYFDFNLLADEFAQQENWLPQDMAPEGKKLYSIPYDRIWASVRDGQIIPLGGRVLIEAEVEDVSARSEILVMPDSVEAEKFDRGVVRYIGTPLKGDNLSLDAEGLKVGDRVVYPKYTNIEMEIEGKMYDMVRHYDILAILCE